MGSLGSQAERVLAYAQDRHRPLEPDLGNASGGRRRKLYNKRPAGRGVFVWEAFVRAVIFANGECPNPQEAMELVHSDDLVLAADGGTRHALAAGVIPQVVIGDLDSLSPADQACVEAAGSQFVRFSPRKDETDLELALLYAARGGATEIVVLGALGGRLDQTIANVLLLALPELRNIDVRIVAGPQEAFLIQGEAAIEGQPGDVVSLIPLGGDAVDVTTDGLEWRLEEDTLHFGLARGVSNVLAARRAHVRVRQGSLLCVVMHAE
jgi:thiamine pyrophosphokinase